GSSGHVVHDPRCAEGAQAAAPFGGRGDGGDLTARGSRSAVSPASGRAAPVVSGTAEGSSASEPAGTAAYSAQPACGGWPTTRLPIGGPPAAVCTTMPAMSLPGRQPGRGMPSNWNVSP